jgi:ribosomal protein L11 methyltransferase
MTLKATLIAAFPEARRIFNFLERDYSDAGVAVSLGERPDGRWCVEAYFERHGAAELAKELRDRLGADALGLPLRIEVLQEADWVAAGLGALKPVAAGRFLIHGSHDRHRIPPGRVAIEIDAGQAFGTGHHATTAGCLVVLDRLMRSRHFTNPLDLGTGSGVLAITMAMTLRRPVLATDIDPVAIRVAAANAMINHVGHLVEAVVAAGADRVAIRRRAPFDLVVANILAEPLVRLAPRLVPLIAQRGTLVLSGLLPNQRERVVAAYGIQGIRLEMARIFEGWAVLVMRKRG